MVKLTKGLLAIAILAIITMIALPFFSGGQEFLDRSERHVRMGLHKLFYRYYLPLPSTPKLKRLQARLKEKGLRLGAPVFVRIFKKEAKLEIWLKGANGFERFSSYPICYYSGRLGPKRKRGDHQAPEGFYTVSKRQLNPKSRWHRAFNLGYPNLFDRSHKRTGDYLMVHGGCSSVGCYAMTNKVIDEIWEIVTAALNKGQQRFHVHSYPFRMTARNMRRHKKHKWYAFWQDLKTGHDQFEETKVPPVISVCKGHYQSRPARKGSNGNAALRKQCQRAAQL